jgi:hypothetical protein
MVLTFPRDILSISFYTEEPGFLNDTIVLPPMFDCLNLHYVVEAPSEVEVEPVCSADVAAYVIPDAENPLTGVIRINTKDNIYPEFSKVLVMVSSKTRTTMKKLVVREAILVRVDPDRVDIEADGGDLEFHFSHNTPYSISIPDSAKTWCIVVKPTVTGYQLKDTRLADTSVVVHVGPNDWTKSRRTSVTISNHFGVGRPASITFYIYQDAPVPKSSGSKSGIPKTYSVNTAITAKHPERPDSSGPGDRPPGGDTGAPPKLKLR